jgi:hypothetical protein
MVVEEVWNLGCAWRSDGMFRFSLLIYSWHMCIFLSIILADFMCLWDVLVIVVWLAMAER